MVALVFHRFSLCLSNRLAGVNRRIEKKWGRSGNGEVPAAGRGWGVAFGAWAGAGDGRGKHGFGGTPSGGRGFQSVGTFS